jgi:hypothetical protein
MTAPAPQTVKSIHWFNWVGYPTVIADATQIVAGVCTSVQYQPSGGIFLITLGTVTLRYGALDQITIATPAAASQALQGVPLTPQTP